jgi:hypothetical protein
MEEDDWSIDKYVERHTIKDAYAQIRNLNFDKIKLEQRCALFN